MSRPTDGWTLVTGAAGFIGFHLCRRLLDDGRAVVGVDNLDDYYDVGLKERRLDILRQYEAFRFHRLDIGRRDLVEGLFSEGAIRDVVNLAAQAGLQHSIDRPHAYLDTNIHGFLNLLEACRHHGVRHMVFASSSSVYGLNGKMPCSVYDAVDHPISLYAATKKSNELMAHTYSHLFGIPCTGLRFFTVYGPWGRPDMALFLFTSAILEGRPIKVFNHGRMKRDFAYIDDIVEGVARVLTRPPAGREDWDALHPDPSSSSAPYRLYNLGTGNPVDLMDFIQALESALGMTADKEFLPMQPGDVMASQADLDSLIEDFDFQPETSIEDGVRRFVTWYREYYRL